MRMFVAHSCLFFLREARQFFFFLFSFRICLSYQDMMIRLALTQSCELLHLVFFISYLLIFVVILFCEVLPIFRSLLSLCPLELCLFNDLSNEHLSQTTIYFLADVTGRVIVKRRILSMQKSFVKSKRCLKRWFSGNSYKLKNLVLFFNWILS